MRHRIRRQTMGKDAIKKSGTKIDNIGQGDTSVYLHELVAVDAGFRNTTGNTTNVLQQQSTDAVCNVGNIIKYINLCIQIAPRMLGEDPPNVDPIPDDNGWLEYAIVKYKENRTNPDTSNLGTNTLGDVCTKAFRGDCLWTGCLPIGAIQGNALDLVIKLPKIITKIQLGTSIALFCHFRSVNSTDLRSDSHRLVTSFHYKCYT